MEYLPTDCFIKGNNLITTCVTIGLLCFSFLINIVLCCRCGRCGRLSRQQNDDKILIPMLNTRGYRPGRIAQEILNSHRSKK